jgi:hypothetical protein
MATKQFKDLVVNEEFVLNSISYKKIEEKRISCCRSINACEITNDDKKIQVKPLEEVTVNNE